MIYIPKHFRSVEMFPAELLNLYPEQTLWKLMDDRILIFADLLRDDINKPIMINNGTALQQRGFRTDSSTGAKFSQHRFGRAIDFDVKGMSSEEVRIHIIDNHERYRPYISRIERGTSWVHVDCCNSDINEIMFFNP